MTPEEKRERKKLNDKNYRERNAEKLKEKRKEYYEKNKEVLKENQKDYRDSNKEKIKEYKKNYVKNNKTKVKQYFIDNKEELKEKRKEYVIKNKEKLLEKRREYEKNRRLNDPLYRIKGNLRNMLGKVFYRNGFSKKSKTHDILGCTYEEFKLHLESKFEPWMTWDNYGLYNGQLNYGWDIDHIIPLNKAMNEEELLKLNHYTNLQPLCSYQNRDIKKGK